jgi:hypothetical protein
MELVDKYLDETTLMADFWIADFKNKIQNFANEAITIRKSKTYLKAYWINIYIKKEHYSELDHFAEGWEKKHPKVVITKASGRVEAYEIRYKKAVEKEEHWVLEFAGELIK